MPLTTKWKKIKKAMTKEYWEKKWEQVFYASINKWKIKWAEWKKTLSRKKKK